MAEGDQKSVGWTFFNHPRKMDAEEYGKTMEKIVRSYSSLPQILSIYDWGNPRHPGISDIDVLFICQNTGNPLPFLKRSFMSLPKKDRYLARHPFVFIGKEEFENLCLIYPDSNLRKVFGKSFAQKKLDPKERKQVLLLLLCDLILRHYPRDFFWQHKSKKMNVRDSLLRLNSLRYTLRLMEEIFGKKFPEWESLCSRVESLRSNWFVNQDHDELIALCELAIERMFDLIGMSAKLLRKTSEALFSSKGELRFEAIKNKAIFIDLWTSEIARKRMEGEEGKKGYSILPKEIAIALACYAYGNGKISLHIREHLSPKSMVIVRPSAIALRRISILDKQAELAHTLCHSDFVAFFDFGYRNRSGINNTVLRMIDKIRF